MLSQPWALPLELWSEFDDLEHANGDADILEVLCEEFYQRFIAIHLDQVFELTTDEQRRQQLSAE
eukprot:2807596-Karenia_brevis.AAC.1